MLQLENDYAQFGEEEICEHLESNYPPNRLELALREQTKMIKREQPEWFLGSD